MENTFFLSGIGGQGIQMLGKVILCACNELGVNGSYFPTYTGTRRGGYSFCSVICSEDRIGAPVRYQYDYTCLMDLDSYEIFNDKTKPGGTMLVNSDMIPESEEKEGVTAIRLPMNTYAEEIGDPLAFNVILGGILARLSLITPLDIFKKQILDKLARNPAMRALYAEAFEKGVQIADAINV